MADRSDRSDDAPRPDPAAAGRWLDAYGNYLFSYALSRVGDRHAAEDLVQETLLGAMQSQARFEHRAAERTWLTAILRNKIVDHFRRTRGSSPEHDSTAAHPGPVDEAALERFIDSQFDKRGIWRHLPGRWGRRPDDPHVLPESDEFRRVLIECLESLAPKTAEAIDLAERCGMSLKQISNLLDVTTTNVGVMLHRGRTALRRCLELRWFGD